MTLVQKLCCRSRRGEEPEATGAEAETEQFLPCGSMMTLGGGRPWPRNDEQQSSTQSLRPTRGEATRPLTPRCKFCRPEAESGGARQGERETEPERMQNLRPAGP